MCQLFYNKLPKRGVCVCLPPSGICTHRLACVPHPLAAAVSCDERRASLYNGRARPWPCREGWEESVAVCLELCNHKKLYFLFDFITRSSVTTPKGGVALSCCSPIISWDLHLWHRRCLKKGGGRLLLSRLFRAASLFYFIFKSGWCFFCANPITIGGWVCVCVGEYSWIRGGCIFWAGILKAIVFGGEGELGNRVLFMWWVFLKNKHKALLCWMQSPWIMQSFLSQAVLDTLYK